MISSDGMVFSDVPAALDLAEAQQLSEVFFSPDWCRRRVARLSFLEERRGEWSINVDFQIPSTLEKLELLQDGPNILVPLLTFRKDLIPRAHVRTEDEQLHRFAIASTKVSRTMACMILMYLAEEAGLCLSHVAEPIGMLSDTDPSSSWSALRRLHGVREDCCHRHTLRSLPATPHTLIQNRLRFLMAARLFQRSIILLASFPHADLGRHKVINFVYDGPIRITKNLRERFGLVPLRIAVPTIFGGDAQSYHMQLEPPDGIVVVDSRLFYSYRDLSQSTARRVGPNARDQELQGSVIGQHENPATLGTFETASRHWWGCVEGAAEPMSAHVRCGGRRMPRMIEGRDAYAVFHLYPQTAGFVGEMLFAMILNTGFVAALYAGLVRTTFLDNAVKHNIEAIFIIGVLVAGLGSGLAFYPKEHLLTSQVARPWRTMVAILVLVLIASLVTCIWGAGPHGGMNPESRHVLGWLSYLSGGVAFVLGSLSLRARRAQLAGSRRLVGRQGYRLRRLQYRFQSANDDRKSSSPSRRGTHRKDRLLTKMAENYLSEDRRRSLFNMGIPPASRHERTERGSHTWRND